MDQFLPCHQIKSKKMKKLQKPIKTREEGMMLACEQVNMSREQ
jgi:hypothetical protein